MTDNSYGVHLNFLAVEGDIPSFVVHRRLRPDTQEQNPDKLKVRAYSLPVTADDVEQRSNYWVSLEPLVGFEPFTTQPKFNVDLVRWVLLDAIHQASKGALSARNEN